jgi:hypothetical protein
MSPTRRFHPARSRSGSAAVAAVLVLTIASASAAAHGPDPTLSGGPFGQNQDLRYRWRSGSEPTAAIKTAVQAAAAAVNASRGSRAATFTYDTAGSNPIGYGTGATCGVNGLACFTRTVPTGFTIWLREQGHVFDWGTLRWCQSYSSPPDGCYDAETITLDEMGHVEGLDHHLNYSTNSDYDDAVVQTFSRTKPSTGWNRHAFGRCDIATLQRQYDMPAWTSRYSTCLDLATNLTLTASPPLILYGDATVLTASLTVVDYDSYVRLGGNPVSGRTVTLQRRATGTTAWTTVGTMPAGSTAGTYVLAQRPSATTDFRAVFATPTTEGINGDTSPTIRVSVTTCSGSARALPGIDAPCL